MKLYIVEEQFISNPLKYVVFGKKALNELESLTSLKMIKIMNSSEFKKSDYPTSNNEYFYFTLDTNSPQYHKNVSKICNQ